MNRDEVLELATGLPYDEIPSFCEHYRLIQDLATMSEVWSILGIDTKRVIVRDSRPVGPDVSSAMTTIPVIAFRHLYTVEEHRGHGHATTLILEELGWAASHALAKYVALFSPPDAMPFFARLGFEHPERSPDGFMVYALTDEAWPDGQVRADPW